MSNSLHDYIWILLLIAPGFACQTILGFLNNGHKEEDGLRLVLSSLWYSIWILAINCLILNLAFQFETFDEVANEFIRIRFILQYIGLTIFSLLICAMTISFIFPYLPLSLINMIRWFQKKNLITIIPLWKLAFKGPYDKAVVIQKDGQVIAKGIIIRSSGGNNQKRELYLKPAPKMKSEVTDEELRGIYVDCDHNLVIKILDPSKHV